MPPRRIYEHSGPAELVLEGENLTPDTLKLYHNGVLYTPLESSYTYAYYLLGDNGTNKVMLNGKNFSTVIVKNIVVPEGLPTRINAWQSRTTSVFEVSEDVINHVRIDSASCINYPHRINEGYPYYLLSFSIGNMVEENIAFVNCSINNTQFSAQIGRLNVSVTDPTKPAYIKYQDFIIAVFNYSA